MHAMPVAEARSTTGGASRPGLLPPQGSTDLGVRNQRIRHFVSKIHHAQAVMSRGFVSGLRRRSPFIASQVCFFPGDSLTPAGHYTGLDDEDEAA